MVIEQGQDQEEAPEGTAKSMLISLAFLVLPFLEVLQPEEIDVIPWSAEPPLELAAECSSIVFVDGLHSFVHRVQRCVENQFQPSFLGPGSHAATSIRSRNLSTTFSLSTSRYS